MKVMDELRRLYGGRFSEVFKTITADNGSEFAESYKLEELTDTKVFFTHAYSSYEKGTVERHNGLIRREIPKGKSMKGLTERCGSRRGMDEQTAAQNARLSPTG